MKSVRIENVSIELTATSSELKANFIIGNCKNKKQAVIYYQILYKLRLTQNKLRRATQVKRFTE